MLRTLFAIVLFVALAGRALALNITIAPLGVIPGTQLLAIPEGPYTPECSTQCNTANSSILACGDSNDKCLCTNTIGSQLQQCEQCLFTQLIDMNMKMPDPRVGSTAAMTAFVTACNASAAVVLTPLTLVPPPSMHGPTDIILNTPATVVVVGFGAVLGGSALYLFASL